MSTCASASALRRSAWRSASSSDECRKRCASFSTPSKHRKAPPIIINGTISGTFQPRLCSHASSALIASAAGTRITLLTSEPLATAHTTGRSRLALTPVTCCAFSARSSPSTPAVFLAATLVMTETSSRIVAMSSNNAKKLLPAI
ncbi:hypothetical protein G6F68_016216 [Rhizopus microsporus]|nr:hypothetical protein G6F68_016216 [Rhizopus microsporus]